MARRKRTPVSEFAVEPVGRNLRYHADRDGTDKDNAGDRTDVWTGPGSAEVNQRWQSVKEKAESLIEDFDRTFHDETERRMGQRHGSGRAARGTFKVGTHVTETHADLLGFTHPKDRYSDLIKLLENKAMSAETMLAMLTEQQQASFDYAVQHDSARGNAQWSAVNHDIPGMDSLVRYH